LAYLVPDFQNPTGAFVPDDDRREVLAAASAVGSTVVVDESFVELDLTGPPRGQPSAALDRQVVTIGSLSKPVWGGVRLGWVRAEPDLIRRLAVLRAGIDLAGSALDQLVGVHLVERLSAITAGRRAELVPRRDALAKALGERLPAWRFELPTGGLSLWVELDAPLGIPLSLLAAQHGVQLVTGSRFGVDGTLERFLRLPYCLPEDRLTEAVRRLAHAWSSVSRSTPALDRLVVA
jgi:DNA-binding transcriptional MocR family regulator